MLDPSGSDHGNLAEILRHPLGDAQESASAQPQNSCILLLYNSSGQGFKEGRSLHIEPHFQFNSSKVKGIVRFRIYPLMMRGLRKPSEGQEIQLEDYDAVPATGGDRRSSVYSVRSHAVKWLPSWPKVSDFRLRGKGFTLFKREKSEHEEQPFLSRSLSPFPSFTHRERRRRFDLSNGSHLCLLLVILVLILNLIFIIWGSVAHLEREEGLVVVHRGTCSWTKKVNSVLHIVINILASTLLGASSFMMQRLAAPTRDDVDRTHQKYQSVSIGSLSCDCFSYMSKRNLMIFFILWTSSIPIHLL